ADPTGSQIEAMAFDPASASYHVLGIQAGGPIDRSPAIAAGANGSMAILWASQAAPGGETSVIGQVFDSSDQAGARWNFRHGNRDIQATAIAPTSQGFIGMWTEVDASSSVLLGQSIGSDGSPVGNPVILSSVQAQAVDPAVAAGANGLLVAWADNRDGSQRVYGQLLDASGQRQGSDFPISDGTGVKSPEVTWDGQQYWVSWFDGRAGLPGAYDAYVQAIAANGGLQGSNVLVSDHRMVPSNVAPRVVPYTQGDVVVFGGQAVDESDSTALAPAAIYASELTPGATPSVPFALSAIDSTNLVDARTWGTGLVVLGEQTNSNQLALDYSYFDLPGSSYGPIGGSGYPLAGPSTLHFAMP
ncbi:MAG: hypothetical protein KGR26_03555, partial [Cyanobacteria bacterium REEB65]|nr:hypothetical protein [Cyanobacteria bacterium REEB65]